MGEGGTKMIPILTFSYISLFIVWCSCALEIHDFKETITRTKRIYTRQKREVVYQRSPLGRVFYTVHKVTGRVQGILNSGRHLLLTESGLYSWFKHACRSKRAWSFEQYPVVAAAKSPPPHDNEQRARPNRVQKCWVWFHYTTFSIRWGKERRHPN